MLSSDTAIEIAKIKGCQSKSCVQDVLEFYICRFNIEYYLITCLPMSDVPVPTIVLANKWPKSWWDHYLHNNFMEYDQVIKECLRNDAIIQWDENTPDYQGASHDLEKIHQIRKDADEFGLRRGFVVPIHRAHGFCGAVSYVGRDIDVSEQDKPLLHLISIYAFEHLYKISELEHLDTGVLTKREVEVTQWAAKGNTTEQIADCVGITPRTVTMHLQNATRKLGASNRTHLVARALQLGEIEF